MTEIERMLDQLQRAFEGPAWHGPSIREVLAPVDAAIAMRRSLAHVHTIWEIVEHVAAWEAIARRRLEGEIVTATPAMDWPPVAGGSEAAWQDTLQRLHAGHDRLRATVAAFPEPKLDAMRPDGETTWYALIHGIIQHDLYHAGQIAILAKTP